MVGFVMNQRSKIVYILLKEGVINTINMSKCYSETMKL